MFMPDYGTARADFPGGDARALYRSVRRVALPPRNACSCATTTRRPTATYSCGKRRWRPNGRATSISTKAMTEDEFVAMRTARDATLDMPRLILPSVQVNIRAGHLPEPEDDGVATSSCRSTRSVRSLPRTVSPLGDCRRPADRARGGALLLLGRIAGSAGLLAGHRPRRRRNAVAESALCARPAARRAGAVFGAAPEVLIPPSLAALVGGLLVVRHAAGLWLHQRSRGVRPVAPVAPLACRDRYLHGRRRGDRVRHPPRAGGSDHAPHPCRLAGRRDLRRGASPVRHDQPGPCAGLPGCCGAMGSPPCST